MTRNVFAIFQARNRIYNAVAAKLWEKKRRVQPLFCLWFTNLCIQCCRDGQTLEQFEEELLGAVNRGDGMQGVGDGELIALLIQLATELWAELKPIIVEVLRSLLQWVLVSIPTDPQAEAVFTGEPENMKASAEKEFVTVRGRVYYVEGESVDGLRIQLHAA